MPSATPTSGIIVDILSYAMFLFIAVTIISFIVGMIRSQSCCRGEQNAYEHFQDANPINNHIYTSLTNMNATFDKYTQNLQDTIDNTGNMKAQTCSIYKSVHDKFIKSKAAEVADQSEYQLPRAQQQALQQTRAKNAESTWANQIALYLYRHKQKGMLDCSQVAAAPAAEGFQDSTEIAPATLDNLSQNLEGKIKIFSQLLESPVVQEWLKDCTGIEGTANYLNMYINNTQVTAEINKCESDYKKNISDYSTKSDEDQQKDNDKAQSVCNMQYGSHFENFQNQPYVNNKFSFPVPYPTIGLTSEQMGYYTVLSQGQDLLTKFSTQVGNIYQNAQAAYTRMNNTNNTFLAYQKQMNSVQNSNYSKSQAESLKS
jgi:hypothetical protein